MKAYIQKLKRELKRAQIETLMHQHCAPYLNKPFSRPESIYFSDNFNYPCIFHAKSYPYKNFELYVYKGSTPKQIQLVLFCRDWPRWYSDQSIAKEIVYLPNTYYDLSTKELRFHIDNSLQEIWDDYLDKCTQARDRSQEIPRIRQRLERKEKELSELRKAKRRKTTVGAQTNNGK